VVIAITLGDDVKVMWDWRVSAGLFDVDEEQLLPCGPDALKPISGIAFDFPAQPFLGCISRACSV